jgi:hypothetical protein
MPQMLPNMSWLVMALPTPEWCDTRQNTGENMPYTVFCMSKVQKINASYEYRIFNYF